MFICVYISYVENPSIAILLNITGENEKKLGESQRNRKRSGKLKRRQGILQNLLENKNSWF